MKDEVKQSGSVSTARPGLRSLDSWLKEIGRTHTTAWRWRRDGWLKTVNIAGRVYVTDDAIAQFIRRAESGEFAQNHITPKRAPVEDAA